MGYSLKQKLGAVNYDLARFLWSMRPSPPHTWVFMRNRDERLIRDASVRGAKCDWRWTSDLHIAKVFPSLGRALMKRALRDWPIDFRMAPLQVDAEPEVSFIMGHRGDERLPHLLLTLESVAAQRDASIECIVVEQSTRPQIEQRLPSWVRYVHTPITYADMAYSRSWAFNVGARMARGNVLVLHDNDMLVPQDYASQIIARFSEGYEVINLKRFIFYLGESHSAKVFGGDRETTSQPAQSVVQNLEAGGSVAVARDAYFAIGGFDESFIGWGGEDNEFWERAQTRKVWPYAYLPIVHLWHPMQASKNEQERSTAKLLELRSAIPPQQRIAELTAREFGSREALGVRDQKSEVRSQKSEAEVRDQKSEMVDQSLTSDL